MSLVAIPKDLILKVVGAFDNYDEAKALATEVFTCAIIAIGDHGNGEMYLRPAETKDTNIFAWAVITL